MEPKHGRWSWAVQETKSADTWLAVEGSFYVSPECLARAGEAIERRYTTQTPGSGGFPKTKLEWGWIGFSVHCDTARGVTGSKSVYYKHAFFLISFVEGRLKRKYFKLLYIWVGTYFSPSEAVYPCPVCLTIVYFIWVKTIVISDVS